MTPRFLIPIALFALATGAQGAAPHSFTAGQGRFLYDGVPFTVKAAELHYPRIPRPYWQHRIQMCKALGMNSICLYVFWNAHESEPGKFDFTGQNDLREFIKLCEAEEMKVILRPGPYVCAEWEMGGLPWWLLKDKDIRLREDDPRFLKRVRIFEQEVARQVADLTAPNGGPIIMIQVENEYGSYDKNKAYVGAIRDMLRELYGDVTMFQCDWSSNFLDNGLPDLLWTLNFGTGANIDEQFAPLRRERPDSPLMCSEYWSGWFDKWGAAHETRSASEMIAGLGEMLDKEISFSLYMTHGGTNWGHWAGANSPGYAPDVTSYDYDAPVDEQGSPTPKYHELRALLQRYTATPLPPVPAPVPVAHVRQFSLSEVAPMSDFRLPTIADSLPRNMEAYGQGFGSIAYTTTLPAVDTPAQLIIDSPRDYLQVWTDSTFIGSLDRRLAQTTLTLPPLPHGAHIHILAEAMGRINFGRAIKDFKGIEGNVTIVTATDTIRPDSWRVALLPDTEQFYASLPYKSTASLHPDNSGRLPRGVYRGTFTVDTPADTYLDFSNWGKGLVYVNGHPLGRIWEIGPQLTLYTPGCWLREGNNEILVMDILGPRSLQVQGLPTPIIDRVSTPMPTQVASFDTGDALPIAEVTLTPGNGWQQIPLPSGGKGRYLCVEAITPLNSNTDAAIAELQLTGADGKPLPRESWRTIFTSSELTTGGNHSGDKAFDQQESTYWASAPGHDYPHRLVIDLGATYSPAALRYLPRMEAGVPGGIGSIKIYLLP